MTPCYDMAVVGGGLAGATLACALADTGLTIALIEARAQDVPQDEATTERTTALAWGTRTAFEALDLWAGMADAAEPIKRLHVSQRARLGRVWVDADEYGLPALGYVVSNAVMLDTLHRRLQALETVDVITPARFQALRYTDDDRIELSLIDNEQPRTLSTRLLVGADGIHSDVRQALGIGADVTDYQQSAIITAVTPERPHAGCAFERFDADGPIAVLPRTAESCAVVWALPSESAERLCSADEDEFVARLQEAFGQRLGALTLAGPRHVYPLARVVCDKSVTQRAVLMGSAGHALHPAAAQGFNLAIRDAVTLASMLSEQQRLRGKAFDPGNADWLAGWAGARRPDQHRVAGFTDRIVQVFSNRIPGLAAARSAGLLGLSLAPGIRHDMARRSLGLALVEQAISSAGVKP